MKLHQLRALRTIAESGSLQEASRLLEVTQPSLSKAVKELEGELGVPLLVRSNRGVTVTAYGERLVSMARLVTEEVRRARDEIDTLKGEMAGRVAIGVSPVTPNRAFANCFKRYRELHPNVQLQIFELRSVQLFEGLKEGRLDLVLTTQPVQDAADGQVWYELAPQPSALAVRKGIPWRGLARCTNCWTRSGCCPTRWKSPWPGSFSVNARWRRPSASPNVLPRCSTSNWRPAPTR